jgi:hypothetical protein
MLRKMARDDASESVKAASGAIAHDYSYRFAAEGFRRLFTRSQCRLKKKSRVAAQYRGETQYQTTCKNAPAQLHLFAPFDLWDTETFIIS